jgi:hypothetical protein
MGFDPAAPSSCPGPPGKPPRSSRQNSGLLFAIWWAQRFQRRYRRLKSVVELADGITHDLLPISASSSHSSFFLSASLSSHTTKENRPDRDRREHRRRRAIYDEGVSGDTLISVVHAANSEPGIWPRIPSMPKENWFCPDSSMATPTCPWPCFGISTTM